MSVHAAGLAPDDRVEECPRCGGEGMVEIGTTQDYFGNWDTVEVVCECPDAGWPEGIGRLSSAHTSNEGGT